MNLDLDELNPSSGVSGAAASVGLASAGGVVGFRSSMVEVLGDVDNVGKSLSQGENGLARPDWSSERPVVAQYVQSENLTYGSNALPD